MSFWGNLLCFTTCHFCPGETGEGLTNLGGIFLLEVFMPFPFGKIYIYFGETFFPLEDFSFLISCFEGMDTFHYFPFLWLQTLFFLLPIHTYEPYIVWESIPFFILPLGENLSSFFAFSTALKSVVAMLIEANGGNGSSISHFS